jgi:hypothetical protein
VEEFEKWQVCCRSKESGLPRVLSVIISARGNLDRAEAIDEIAQLLPQIVNW